MKVLLVGPYPPPHGGISVHVWSAHTLMKRAGQQSSVLNVDPRARESRDYIKVAGALDLVRELFAHTLTGWTLSVHTNGHNPKSWLIALLSGIAAQVGPAATLTLHSGVVPSYLGSGPAWRRLLARVACRMYARVVCVNSEIAQVIAGLGIPESRLAITPAFLPIETPEVVMPEAIESWLGRHEPVVSSAMFFRPEYGFELLVQAVAQLRKRYPMLGLLVMGSGEDRRQATALVDKTGLQDTIHLAGDLDHELCLSIMARSDVFIRPTYRDGDSISVREAMSMGVPVVASNVGTRPEGTLLFEPGDVDGLIVQSEVVFESTAYARRQPVPASPRGEWLVAESRGPVD